MAGLNPAPTDSSDVDINAPAIDDNPGSPATEDSQPEPGAVSEADKPHTPVTLDPREKAIVDGFRKQYPMYTPDKITDEDLLPTFYQKFYSKLDPDHFEHLMQQKFAPDWKAAVPVAPAPKPTLGQTIGAIGKNLPAIGGEMAKGLAHAFTSPSEAAGNFLAGKQLENTANTMPAPNIADLRKRGYSEQQIKNIVTGYTATQNSLMKDVQEEGAHGVSNTALAAANYATLPLGGEAAEAALAKAGGQALGKTVLGQAVKHAVTGGALGGLFGATESGIEQGAKAAAAGLPTHDVLQATTKGIFTGGLSGAKFGAIVGGVLGTGAEQMGQAVSRRAMLAAAKAKASADQGIIDFANKFQPQWLSTRFGDMAVVKDPNTPAQMVTSALLNKLLGQEAQTNAPQEALLILNRKVEAFRKLSGIDPSLRDAQPFGPQEMPGQLPTQPLGDTNVQSFATPENLPAAVQGPIGQGNPTPQLPADVPQMPDVQPTAPAGQAPAPALKSEANPTGEPLAPIEPGTASPDMMPQTGTVPSEQPTTGTPLGVNAGPEMEPHGVDLGPPSITPRIDLPNVMDLQSHMDVLGAPGHPLQATAVRVNGKVYRGKPGEIHMGLIGRLITEGKIKENWLDDITDNDLGFMTRGGVYVTREGAEQIAGLRGTVGPFGETFPGAGGESVSLGEKGKMPHAPPAKTAKELLEAGKKKEAPPEEIHARNLPKAVPNVAPKTPYEQIAMEFGLPKPTTAEPAPPALPVTAEKPRFRVKKKA